MKGTKQGWEWNRKRWESERRRMGIGQRKDGNGTEEGWEWDRRKREWGRRKIEKDRMYGKRNRTRNG